MYRLFKWLMNESPEQNEKDQDTLTNILGTIALGLLVCLLFSIFV